MAPWLIFFITLFVCLAVKLLLVGKKKKLPPGPPSLPIVGNLFLIGISFSNVEPILRQLRTKFGSILTLYVGSRPSIFITTHALTHQALIQNGAVFADRPPAPLVSRIFGSNQHSISSAAYGPLWRLLRRNLISEALNPSRIKSYSTGRKWVLNLLTSRLMEESHSGEGVCVMETFRFSMFCLLLFMCFGEKLDEAVVRGVETVQRNMLVNFGRLTTPFNIFPRLGKIIFRKRWMEVLAIRRRQEEVLIPLIETHKEAGKEGEAQNKKKHERVFSYIDSLLALDLPEGRKLNDGELVTLCSEFLNGGTDTTSTSLQWIMANLIKHPKIQAKLVEEIEGVVGLEEGIIKEEYLQKMPYLKAVIMEALRRHPPGHFVLPHAVSEEVSLEGYVIPKNATVNFMVAEMGIDPKVWEDPLEFRPERFLDGGEVVDITGSREIKMMPFGAGRRICPGLGVALLHLEYFVANLVWEFEWKAKEGEEVDLSEKLEFTVVMKNPLQAVLVPRRHWTDNGVGKQ